MPELFELISRMWQPARQVWPIVAAACLGLALAVAAWFAVSIWEERLARAKFTALASDYATVLQTGLDDHLGKILAVRAFYDASARGRCGRVRRLHQADHARLRRCDAAGLEPAR
jgi:CHASE1-domain containing sensor protein